MPQTWSDGPTGREQEYEARTQAEASGRPFDLADDKYKHW